MGGVLASLSGLLVDTRLMTAVIDLRVERRGDGWVLAGPDSQDVRLVNDYLGYLGDRHYAPGTRRGYAFDLLALLRWLAGQDRRLDQVDAETLLRFLASCRKPGTPAGSASTEASAGALAGASAGGRREGLAAATVNRRLAAVSGLFTFRAMRDPTALNPMPKGAAARRAAPGQREGLLGHLARPQPRSALRVREPRRLPRALAPGEASALLESLHSWRDRAIAGLMLFSRAALGRGSGPDGGRCGHRSRLGPGERQGRAGTPRPGRRPGRRLDPDLPAGRTPGHRHDRAVRGGQGPQPGPAADPGRAAHDLPLPPGPGRGDRGAPARAAALVRYLPWLQPGEGRGLRVCPGTCLTSIRNSFVPVVTFAT